MDESMAQEQRALLIRPRPIRHESAYGYLVRVAAANGFDSPRALWAALRTIYDGSPMFLQSLLRLQGREWRRLEGRLPPYIGISVSPIEDLSVDDMCHNTMRWCASCLKESLHLRSIWNIKLVCICDRHNAMLQDRCPSCDSPQRLERAALDRCSCGWLLTATPLTPVPPQTMAVQQALCSTLRSGRADDRWGLDIPRWCKLLRIAGRPLDESFRQRTGQIDGLHCITISQQTSANLASLLNDWPAGLHARLAAQQAASPRNFSIPRTFGRIYKWLYVHLNDPCFQFLRDGFEAYLNEHWWGLMCKRNRRLKDSTRTNHNRQAVSTAAASTTASSSEIHQLHFLGWIDANVIQFKGGRRAWSIPAAEIEQIGRHAADRITLKEAACLLGLGRHRVRELIDAGLLEQRMPRRTPLSAWLLSRQAIVDLHLRCLEHAIAPNGSVPPIVPLKQILKTWRLQASEFPALVAAIVSGEVHVVREVEIDIALGNLSVLTEDAKRWRSNQQKAHRPLLSIDAAGKVLGVKQEVAYQLIRAGLLEAVAAGPKQKRKLVSRNALNTFNALYISLAELARHRQQSPKTLLHKLSAHPICGPDICNVRQYFFLRSDLTEMHELPVRDNPI